MIAFLFEYALRAEETLQLLSFSSDLKDIKILLPSRDGLVQREKFSVGAFAISMRDQGVELDVKMGTKPIPGLQLVQYVTQVSRPKLITTNL
jgi:hypothetical protein